MKYVRTKMAVSTRSTTGAPHAARVGRAERANHGGERTIARVTPPDSRRTRPSRRTRATPELAAFRTAWWQRLLDDTSTYELTRFAVLRLLALVYLVAFLVARAAARPAARLARPPARRAASRASTTRASAPSAYWRVPTLFWLRRVRRRAARRLLGWASRSRRPRCSARRTRSCSSRSGPSTCRSSTSGRSSTATAGRFSSSRRAFSPCSSARSRSVRPLPADAPRRGIVVWLLRWLIFRVMLGAALIKLRNDPCWRDLTCLDYHFETQPNPNPLAWSLHHAPHGVHVARGPLQPLRRARRALVRRSASGRWRHAAGALLVGFPGVPHRERQPLVPQLAHDRPGARVLRRHGVRRACCPRGRRAALLARFAELARRSRSQTRASQVLARRRRRCSASGR